MSTGTILGVMPGRPLGPFWLPLAAPFGPFGGFGALVGFLWGALGYLVAVFWILLKIGHHFPSKCAVVSILLFKIKPPLILPPCPPCPAKQSGVRNHCSDTMSTRAGGWDYGNLTNFLK